MDSEQDQELIPLRSEGREWAEALAERLAQKKIPCRIVAQDESSAPSRHAFRFLVCVRPEDWDRAKEVDLEYYREQVPDVTLEQLRALDDADHCPACGHALAAETAACDGCGLEFPAP